LVSYVPESVLLGVRLRTHVKLRPARAVASAIVSLIDASLVRALRVTALIKRIENTHKDNPLDVV
jgi:hypothetical protein